MNRLLKKWTSVLLFISACLLSSISCKDDFSTDSAYRLSYSADTLDFDTTITGMLTPTRVIKVYNETKKNIHIDQIQLMSEYNAFMININGKSGDNHSNIDLYSGDSLFIFVQLKVDNLSDDLPLVIENHIVFSYNNNLEKIVLRTIGQNAEKLRNKHITQDTTWTNNKPFLIYDSLTVDEGVKLTIEAGTRIIMYDNAVIKVNGSLFINGSLENNVVIKGYRVDYLASGTNYDLVNNQWGGIHFSETSTQNILNYAFVRNGNFGLKIDSAAIDSLHPRLTILNSQIHNMRQCLINANHANIVAQNCVLSNGSNGGLWLQGGNYLFNHCTIAGFEKGTGTHRFSVILSDYDFINNGEMRPLFAQFNNCIISGGSGDKNEIAFFLDETNDQYDFQFNHCLIKQQTFPEGIFTEDRFIEVILNEPPFFTTAQPKEHLYDFHIQENSAAIGKGDPEILSRYPECSIDKDGNDRSSAEAPDLGAYQFLPSEKNIE